MGVGVYGSEYCFRVGGILSGSCSMELFFYLIFCANFWAVFYIF